MDKIKGVIVVHRAMVPLIQKHVVKFVSNPRDLIKSYFYGGLKFKSCRPILGNTRPGHLQEQQQALPLVGSCYFTGSKPSDPGTSITYTIFFKVLY